MYKIEIEISRERMQQIIDGVNDLFVYEDEGDKKLTIEEVDSNEKLRNYLLTQTIVHDDDLCVLIGEQDACCDVKDYR